jgi:hypothetical protein
LIRRTTPRNKMDLAHREEETKSMQKEEKMKDKNKEKEKIHHQRIPLLRQKH